MAQLPSPHGAQQGLWVNVRRQRTQHTSTPLCAPDVRTELSPMMLLVMSEWWPPSNRMALSAWPNSRVLVTTSSEFHRGPGRESSQPAPRVRVQTHAVDRQSATERNSKATRWGTREFTKASVPERLTRHAHGGMQRQSVGRGQAHQASPPTPCTAQHTTRCDASAHAPTSTPTPADGSGTGPRMSDPAP